MAQRVRLSRAASAQHAGMLTVGLLLISNVFMTVAWYWHLRSEAKAMPLVLVILISWLIALPEYCLAMPANRLGHVAHGGPFTAPQLKLIQEGIAISVFLVFSIVVLKEVPTWRDYAGFALVIGGLVLALSGRLGG